MSDHHRSFFVTSIANSLSSFCQIDSADVKSKLLGKSKIKLNDVLLIPKIIHSNDLYDIEMTGRIEVAEFHYKVNVIKGVKSIRKSKLNASGVHVNLHIQAKTPTSHNASFSTDASTSNNDHSSWKKKFLKNIIDQIAIHLQDLTVSLVLPSTSATNLSGTNNDTANKFVMLVKDIDLIALKKEKIKGKGPWKRRQKDSHVPLMQRLEIGSFSANVTESDKQGDEKIIPFIDQFSYSCSLKRFDGERFGGIWSGLEVVGDIVASSFDDTPDDLTDAEDSSSNGLEINAEKDEIEILFSPISHSSMIKASRKEVDRPSTHIKIYLGAPQILALFGTLSCFQGAFNNKDDEHHIHELKSERYFSSIRKSSGKRMMKSSPSNSSTNDVFSSSVYSLPIPSLEAELPNKAVIHLKKCEWQYRTDGSINKVEGVGGASINNVAILNDQGTWFMDATRRIIVIRTTQKDGVRHFLHRDYSIHEHGADFNFHLNEIRQLASGCAELLDLSKSVMCEQSENSDSISWEMHIEGNTKLKF
jgi:hypothetical protein